MRKIYIPIDIETSGLHPWYGDRLTCICAQAHGLSCSPFQLANEEETVIIKGFLTWMENIGEITKDFLHPPDFTFVTANGKAFDFPFLLSRTSQISPEDLYSMRYYLTAPQRFHHFDILTDITDKRISLNNIARILSLPVKTGDGKQAIQWYLDREFDALEAYCMADVELTWKVFTCFISQ